MMSMRHGALCVIANAVKQSMALDVLDCHVAALLAMTVARQSMRTGLHGLHGLPRCARSDGSLKSRLPARLKTSRLKTARLKKSRFKTPYSLDASLIHILLPKRWQQLLHLSDAYTLTGRSLLRQRCQ